MAELELVCVPTRILTDNDVHRGCYRWNFAVIILDLKISYVLLNL